MRLSHCRFCGQELKEVVADLGTMPLANSYLLEADLLRPEPSYPLCVRVCTNCFLVQTDTAVVPQEIFSQYAYFSSYSDSWLAHAGKYCEAMIERFGLDAESRVIEVASNDGYLLKNFVARAIPCLGIEPAENVAVVARAAGVPTEAVFLNSATARQITERFGPAQLVVANNVLAHVPDINEFVAGLRLLLAEDGVLTVEFPHLLELIAGVQFDTIYHEHFFYLSVASVELVFAAHGLRLFDVEQLPTHGGSLRIYAEREGRRAGRSESERLISMRARETSAGVKTLSYYKGFNSRIAATLASLRQFLDWAKAEGKQIVGYGAAAKGNTLLNAGRVKKDEIAYVVDRNPHKQGHYLPGTHIPVYAPERVFESRPDYILILPWNFRDEIIRQMHGITEWNGRFVVPIPQLTIIEP